MSLRLALALAAVPAAGWACTPGEPHGHVRPVFSRGDECAAYWQHDLEAVTSLFGAEDLGSGLVLQGINSGLACRNGEYGFVAMDCRTGEAVAFTELGSLDPGYPVLEGTPQPMIDLREAIRQGAATGAPLSIAEVARRGEAGGLLVSEPLTTTSRISLNGHAFQLGCACRTFYPDLPGAHR